MPPSTDGQWSGTTAFPIPNPTLLDGFGHSLVDTRGLFVLHAAVLHTGKVLVFCGHVESAFYAPLSYVFDPKNPATILTPITFPAGMDLFCCHYVQIPDGRILVIGGSDKDFQHHSSVGAKNICIFDPDTETWVKSKNGGVDNELIQGRWYPTAVLLPDGRVFVASGRPEHGGGRIADKVEILNRSKSDANNWFTTEQEQGGTTLPLPIYPGLHLAPNGRIYFTGTTWGQEIANPETVSILVPSDPSTSTPWTTYPVGTHPAQPRREEGMSVLLPPAQDGKILLIGGSFATNAGGIGLLMAGGGGTSNFDHIAAPTDPLSAEILDTTTDPPTWSPAPGAPMNFGRTNGHCVLLPDATVLIVGGHNRYKWQASSKGTTPSLTAEIFTPGSGFRSVAAMNAPRMYHSVALLLPDGRVLVAGGADPNPQPPPNRGEPVLPWPADWGGPVDVDTVASRTYAPYTVAPGNRLGYTGLSLNNKTFEFYQPPYCFQGPRPKITEVRRKGNITRRIEYKQSFKVETAQAATIDKVSFMRPNVPTHHTDTEQRYVRLSFTKGANELDVTAVDDPKVAPPGYYMLWIVDTNGLPCEEAVFIQLVPRGSSCFIATAALGSPDHPGVVFLRELRQEIEETTRFGRWFIGAVNRLYESFSPQLARYLEKHEAARTAVRDCVVHPTVKVIAVTDEVCRRFLSKSGRYAALMLLLALEGLLGAVSTPVLFAVISARILFKVVCNERVSSEDKEADYAS